MTQKQTFGIALVGLPVGLLFLGIASMLYTQLKPKKPEYDADYNKRMDAASLNRKPVNQPDLERFVRILSEEIGERHMEKPDNLERAAIWIESTLGGGNFGYQVEKQVFPVSGTEVRNLIAELAGKGRRKEIIVVGAHYDTVKDCPGANSGGTGVAAVLSLAHAFAGDPRDRTIRFVFFANGEEPYFGTPNMGSQVYAKRCASRDEKIVAMLSLDSIGCFSKQAIQRYPEGLKHEYPKTADFLAFVGDEGSKFRVSSAKSSYVRATNLAAIAAQIPGLDSDQASFSKYNFPAVLATDTAQFRDPHFHKPTDTREKIDYGNLEMVCQGLMAIVELWATP